jgi:effector-binding domain-containing protein
MTPGDTDRHHPPITETVALVELQPQPTAVVAGHVAFESIPAFLGSAFNEVMEALAGQGLAPAGPPFARWEPQADGFDAEAGFPSTGPVSPTGRVQPQTLPGGLVATALHRGGYAGIGATYEVLNDWIAGHGYVATGQPWESYLDEPGVPEPRTQVYLPCAEAPRRDGPLL